jgi:micrococcal nuclease
VAGPATLQALWTRFRSLPLWAQIVVGILLWPALLAMVIALSGRGPTPVRYGAAALVLVLGLALWLPNGDDGAREAEVAAALAAEAEAADADAAERAAEEAAAEEAAAAARDAEAAAEQVAAEKAAADDDAAAEKAAAEKAATDAAAAAEAAAAEKGAAEKGAAEEAAAAEKGAAEAAKAWTVHHVVDGDTVDVRHADGSEERIRIIGIDTPERGECGFGEASAAMAALVLSEQVVLTAGARDDRDRYDRILRYVDVGGVDAGLALIEAGLAIARYDSRDGYGRHDREATYIAADAATANTCTPPAPAPTGDPAPAPPSSGPGTGPGGAWKNCTQARDAGAAPVRRGTPGYGGHLDRDGDGIGCE